MKCEACLPLVGEFLDGELESRLAGSVRAHIAGCQSCSGYYESLRLNQDLYDKFLEDVKLSSTAWQGVQRKIQQEKIESTRTLRSRFFEKHNWLLIPRFQQAVVLATLGAIVLGIVALRLATRPTEKQVIAVTNPTPVQPPTDVTRKVTPESSPEQPSIRERKPATPRRPAKRTDASVQRMALDTKRVVTSQAVAMFEKAAAFSRAMESARTELEANRPVTLKTDVARHFEKTRLLLLSLKNTSIPETDAGVNVSYEKMVSRKLANSNLLLRRETTTAGDRSAAELLDQIEPLLIEIANMPDRASAAEVASISRRIVRRDVIGLLQSQTF